MSDCLGGNNADDTTHSLKCKANAASRCSAELCVSLQIAILIRWAVATVSTLVKCIANHSDQLQNSLRSGFAGTFGTYIRPHAPLNDLAGFGAHGWAIQRRLRALAMSSEFPNVERITACTRKRRASRQVIRTELERTPHHDEPFRPPAPSHDRANPAFRWFDKAAAPRA